MIVMIYTPLRKLLLIFQGYKMELTQEIKDRINDLIKIYPEKDAALIPALHLARDKFNIVSPELEVQVAEMFGLKPVKVHSVASFYTMLNQHPVGKYNLKFCATLGCAMSGGENLVETACEMLGLKVGEVTADGLFSVNYTECLGSCGTSPVMQINTEPYIENLTREKLQEVIKGLRETK